MTSANCRGSAARKSFQTALILSVPYALYVLTLAFLMAIYGGHHYAYLLSNPFCSIPSPPYGTNAPRLILHISDLHVSDVYKGMAKHSLRSFATQSLPKWAPYSSALLVTGDLVNSAIKQPYPLGKKSKQIHSEWEWLQSFAASVNDSVLWKSVPGNHDSFGGYDPLHFVKGCTGPLTDTASSRVDEYVAVGKPPLTMYGIDATLPRPLHRPLNFFGDAKDLSAQLDNKLSSSSEDGDVLVYGHYPSSTMKMGERVHMVALRKDSYKWKRPRFSAYLSGHLHTLYGLAEQGLQAVSISGTLELQLPDMVRSRAYRVLIFDSGYMSFKDFRVGKDEGLEQVVVMNPPRAGLCSAGAGYGAKQSTHVRLFSAGLNLVEIAAHVWINGEDIGPISKLLCSDEESMERGSTTCDHVYGVRWDPSRYASGTHQLSIRSGSENSISFAFSLDGSPEKNWAPWLERVVGTLFGLSNFPSMAKALIRVAFLFCVFISARGVFSRNLVSLGLVLLSFFLFLGPILIARDLIDGEPGWSFIGIHYMYMPTGIYPAGIDPSYLLASAVVWRSLLPFCFLNALAHRGRIKTFCRKTFLGFLLLYNYGSLSWSLNIWGAHGFLECIISPSCLPLTVGCILTTRKALRRTACE
ncbi:unnamed protein product [Agarophyton chilense]